MKIKLKLFLGFFTLVLMLALAGAYSIIEFTRISTSVNAILEDNYQSIQATKDMLEAIEREDSGILLLLMGNFREGRHTISLSDSIFRRSLDIARNNLTEENEQQYVTNIESYYTRYRSIIEYPIVNTSRQGNIEWYETEVYPLFQDLKKAIHTLMDLNQTSMYREAMMLKEKSKRAIMPGIVAIGAGIVFTLIFNIFINYYLVSPIKRLVRSIRNYKRGTVFGADIETNDELKELENSIRDLTSKI